MPKTVTSTNTLVPDVDESAEGNGTGGQGSASVDAEGTSPANIPPGQSMSGGELPLSPPQPPQADPEPIAEEEDEDNPSVLKEMSEVISKAADELPISVESKTKASAEPDEESSPNPKSGDDTSSQSPEPSQAAGGSQPTKDDLLNRIADLQRQLVELQQQLTDQGALQQRNAQLEQEQATSQREKATLQANLAAKDQDLKTARRNLNTARSRLAKTHRELNYSNLTLHSTNRKLTKITNPATAADVAADSRPRAAILKEKLVDNYKNRKEREQLELERNKHAAAHPAPAAPAAPGVPGAPGPVAQPQTDFEKWRANPAGKDSPKDDIIAETVNDISGKVGMGLSAVGSVWGMADTALDMKYDFDSQGKYKEDNEMNPYDKFANNGLALAGSAVGIVSQGSKLAMNSKKRKKNASKTARQGLNFDTANQILGITANTFKGTGSIVGLSTGGDNDDAKTAKSVLGGIGTALSFTGSAVGLAGNIVKGKMNRHYYNKIEAAHNQNDNNGTYAAARATVKARGFDKTDPANEGAIQSYKAAKARKYGYEQAMRFMDAKKNRYHGGIGFVGSAATSVMSWMNLDKGIKQSKLGVHLGGLGAVTGLLFNLADKAAFRISKYRQENKSIDIKLSEVDKYLVAKRPKVDADAQKEFSAALGVTLTDDEKDRVTLGRLGVDIKVENKPLSKENLLSGFELLNMKRAKNIMESNDKDNILDELGLDRNASLEQVAAALKGE